MGFSLDGSGTTIRHNTQNIHIQYVSSSNLVPTAQETTVFPLGRPLVLKDTQQ
jgi:hypothetical protein